MERLRGGLLFKAHRLLCHPTLGLRVIKKKKKISEISEIRGDRVRYGEIGGDQGICGEIVVPMPMHRATSCTRSTRSREIRGDQVSSGEIRG